MYNYEKFMKFMQDNNLGKKDLADELSVNIARIDELARGKEILPLLDRICNLYNVDINSFYGDYVEPEYMKTIRDKLYTARGRGMTLAEISHVTEVNKTVIGHIINHKTFCCSDTMAHKILNADFNRVK